LRHVCRRPPAGFAEPLPVSVLRTETGALMAPGAVAVIIALMIAGYH
jgi:hypothetical protein